MPLFSRDKTKAVQGFLLKVVNNNCPELAALHDGPRLEKRVNLSVVVLVVPVLVGKPRTQDAFAAVTKEFCTAGVGLVLDQPRTLDEVILGFLWENEMTHIRATARHLTPMGGGFYQMGLQATEVVHPAKFPELEALRLQFASHPDARQPLAV
jgi:hypothetical protein